MFKDFINILKNPSLLTSYNTGLVQAKAFRILKAETNRILKPYGISSTEWAMLGLLYNQPDGLKSLPIAQIIGVEQPFVTVISANLTKMGLIEININKNDRRQKWIKLTSQGKKFVDKTEKIVRKEIRPLIQGVSIKEILNYLKVLQVIVDYSESKEEKK